MASTISTSTPGHDVEGLVRQRHDIVGIGHRPEAEAERRRDAVVLHRTARTGTPAATNGPSIAVVAVDRIVEAVLRPRSSSGSAAAGSRGCARPPRPRSAPGAACRAAGRRCRGPGRHARGSRSRRRFARPRRPEAGRADRARCRPARSCRRCSTRMEQRRRRLRGSAGLAAPHSPLPPFPPGLGTPPEVPQPRIVTRTWRAPPWRTAGRNCRWSPPRARPGRCP